jgi:hypothetical protein
VGRGLLTAVVVACALAASASASRAPVYSVTVAGTMSTSAFVPAHMVDNCWVDGVSGVRTIAFRSTRTMRVTSLKSLRLAVPVRATSDAGGTHEQRRQCDDGTGGVLAIDYAAKHSVSLQPIQLRIAGGRLWLDGTVDAVDGACFGASTPPSPIGLADAYADMPAHVGKRLTLRGEEDGQAQGDGCLLVRSVRWTVTFQRT